MIFVSLCAAMICLPVFGAVIAIIVLAIEQLDQSITARRERKKKEKRKKQGW